MALWMASPPAAPSRITLKDGRVYLLKEPPRPSGTRMVFRTTGGGLFSIAKSEIASIGPAPRPAPLPRRLDPHDSRQLGAIARRLRKGKPVEVAPKPAPAPKGKGRKKQAGSR